MLAVEEQRGDIDAWQHVAEVGFRQRAGHRLHSRRVEVAHDRGDFADDIYRSVLREESGDVFGHNMIGREIEIENGLS